MIKNRIMANNIENMDKGRLVSTYDIGCDPDKPEPFRVKNAVIMAAGLAKRFEPVSSYLPKALCRFKGEVLIERQICQLREAGIEDIYVVVGYKAEMFGYLADKYNVTLIKNESYHKRNNTGSLILVKDLLDNSYICSCDNYFANNIFRKYNRRAYYSVVFQRGETNEWCVETKDSIISEVSIGGADSYVMLGAAYFDRAFSRSFVGYLEAEYEDADVRDNVWEYLYVRHLDSLKMEAVAYEDGDIIEIDTVADALRYDKDFFGK